MGGGDRAWAQDEAGCRIAKELARQPLAEAENGSHWQRQRRNMGVRRLNG
jgi:hypothetical protein